jgi:L-rhamnose mutarotase
MFDLIEAKPKTENEIYLESAEWKELLEKASKAVNQNYTVIYREPNGDLSEAWHWLSNMNMEYIKEKYAKQKREILIFEPKTMEYGKRLASIHGDSKE